MCRNAFYGEFFRIGLKTCLPRSKSLNNCISHNQSNMAMPLLQLPPLRVALILTLIAFAVGQSFAGNNPEILTSPNGIVTVTVTAGNQLDYAIEFNGKDVLLNSPVSLSFTNARAFGPDLAIKNVSRRAVDESWQRVYGKRKQVRNHFNEMTLDLQETTAPNRQVQIIFCAYDDGVAFRYALPKTWGGFELAAENTAFHFPNDAAVWAVNYGGFVSSQEAEFLPMKLSELKPGQVYGCPLLVQVAPSLWAACSEADLSDWAGMYFTPADDSPNTVRTALSPRPDDTNIVVRSIAPRSSPWRVIMVGDRPGAFIESDILENLNVPATFDA